MKLKGGILGDIPPFDLMRTPSKPSTPECTLEHYTAFRLAEPQGAGSMAPSSTKWSENTVRNSWVIKKTAESTIVVLQDTPENIVKRITFYGLFAV